MLKKKMDPKDFERRSCSFIKSIRFSILYLLFFFNERRQLAQELGKIGDNDTVEQRKSIRSIWFWSSYLRSAVGGIGHCLRNSSALKSDVRGVR